MAQKFPSFSELAGEGASEETKTPRSPEGSAAWSPTTSGGMAPPTPLRFPTFEELVVADREKSDPRPNEVDLFPTLISDPTAIFQDLLVDPTRYEEGVDELLQLLVSGQRQWSDLDPDQKRLLNQSVLDYASPHTKPKAQAPALPAEEDLPPDIAEPPPELAPRPVEPYAGPEEAPDPFWWAKSGSRTD